MEGIGVFSVAQLDRELLLVLSKKSFTCRFIYSDVLQN